MWIKPNLIVPAKSTGSWGMDDIFDRRSSRVTLVMSIPSSSIFPLLASTSLNNAAARDDFPEFWKKKIRKSLKSAMSHKTKGQFPLFLVDAETDAGGKLSDSVAKVCWDQVFWPDSVNVDSWSTVEPSKSSVLPFQNLNQRYLRRAYLIPSCPLFLFSRQAGSQTTRLSAR